MENALCGKTKVEFGAIERAMRIHYLPLYILVAIVLASYLRGMTPPLMACLYLVGSIITYLLYAKDKRASINGAWRVPEKTLHLAALLCGWPGAILAQQRLRHKTQKTGFRVMFWLVTLINIAGLYGLHTAQGNSTLASVLQVLQHNIIVFVDQPQLRNVLFWIVGG